MSNTFNLGTSGNWATKKEAVLAYNSENSNFKPLPFTFDRASTATVVNKQGLIETVGIDEPRIDFLNNTKGHLLLEPSRQNEVSTSDHNPNSYWNMQSATFTNSSNTTTPDGGLTAPILTTDITGTFKGITKNQSSAWNSDTYTLSVFAKNIDSDYIFFYNINSTSGTNGVWFNISNGTIGYNGGAWSNVKVENYGNGWYRCSATVTFNSSGTSYLYVLNSDGNANTTSTAGKQTYLWGSQIEQGSYATSYIPTQGSAVTRSAENAFQQNVTQVIGQSEGTMYIEFVPKDTSTFQILYQTRSDSGTIGQVDIRLADGNIVTLANDGGSSQFNMGSTSYSAGITYKVAVRYKLNDSKIYINGVSSGSDTSCSFTGSSLDQISFAENLTSFLPIADILDARLYNTGLSDSQLQALTS